MTPSVLWPVRALVEIRKAVLLFPSPYHGVLAVKVKLVPNDKGSSENAPDFRLQAAGHDIGAAWKKTSEAGRDYLSVTLDDPSFPAPVYARLIEGEDGTHDLIWSRSKPKAA